MAKRCAEEDGANHALNNAGSRVSIHGFLTRRKAFSDPHPLCLYRQDGAKVLGSQVNRVGTIREERAHGERIGRHGGRSGVPEGDSGTSEGWLRYGEGSTRSEKVRAGFASSALKRRRQAVRLIAVSRS